MFDYLKILLDARLAKMDERGASAVEYGLLIAGIAALIVVAVFALGPIVKDAFSDTCNAIDSGNTNLAATCALLVGSTCGPWPPGRGRPGLRRASEGRPPMDFTRSSPRRSDEDTRRLRRRVRPPDRRHRRHHRRSGLRDRLGHGWCLQGDLRSSSTPPPTRPSTAELLRPRQRHPFQHRRVGAEPELDQRRRRRVRQ